MTNPEPIDELLAELIQSMADTVPEEARALAEYRRLKKLSEEVDENGNPTKQAHRARVRLDNPFMVEESPKRSRAKAEKQERDHHAKMAKAIASAVKSWALWRQYRARIEVLDAHEERKLPATRTRQDHDPESIFSLGYPLLETLARENVSPSSFGRLPTFAMKHIADLIKAHARDPSLSDPANLWNQVVHNGMLSAYHGQLSDEEERVIAHAASLRDDEASEWAAKAREALDLPPGFSLRFLKGAELLADATRELTAGEALAYNTAYGLRITRDVELLGKVLNLDHKEHGPRLTALVNFISNVSPSLSEDLRFTIQLVAMKRTIDRIEPAQKLKRDWIAELTETLPLLAEDLGASVDSIEAFDALLTHGLRCSNAAESFEERKAKRKRDAQKAAFLSKVVEACEAGTTFKVVDNDVIWMEDLEFHETDAKEWTAERWIEVHGPLEQPSYLHGKGAPSPLAPPHRPTALVEVEDPTSGHVQDDRKALENHVPQNTDMPSKASVHVPDTDNRKVGAPNAAETSWKPVTKPDRYERSALDELSDEDLR
tara:strand:- start:485 stop:2122 length:1638 start_codon:yes stop_codon:yes gene_type:complete